MRLKFVQAVECGDFVGFSERRIVEDSIAEIVNFAAVIKNGLADVNDFRGALADYMNAEEF